MYAIVKTGGKQYKVAPGDKPVSYTHLDVYKRQLPVLGRAGSVLVGGAHGAGEQLVDALRVARERVERHIACLLYTSRCV